MDKGAERVRGIERKINKEFNEVGQKGKDNQIDQIKCLSKISLMCKKLNFFYEVC